MKRLITSVATFVLAVVVLAIPANKDAVCVQQPDGSYVTVRLHGDEYLHFTTTADGYSVVRNAGGFYVYARLDNGELVATQQVAHDASHRDALEQAFLQGIAKYQSPQMSQTNAQEQQAEQARRQRSLAARRAATYDYDNFRGLILLMEYNDRSFSREDYADVMNDMVNQEGYAGYDRTNRGRFTGSVRDYFTDNSNGIFKPEFDIVGPVQIDRSQYYANSTQNAAQLMLDALTAADSLVDYSQYDRDGNGEVDMVFFIFAGLGANFGSNDQRLLWPHASSIYNPQTWNWVYKDGVRFGRYACSTELYGYTNNNFLDGIGVICHEFGHVLGLPDLYDTDYEGSGGESNHPDLWTIMASGGYQNYGRTPTGYTLYERYALGFSQPQLIDSLGSYSLERLDLANSGYRIDSPTRKEFFLLENRQRSFKWDAYLPGHGMLVFRVDSTNANIWRQNNVNSNPSHNYFELLRAGNGRGSSASDPFPGTSKVAELNGSTTPALASWRGQAVQYGLLDIEEHNEVISFGIEDTYVLRDLVLPDSFALPLGFMRRLDITAVPSYAPYELTWTSSDESVAVVDAEGLLTGVGEGTCKVTAVSDGGLRTSCIVTVSTVETVDGLATFKAMGEEAEVMVKLTDAQVLYAYQGDYYLHDATGAIVLSGTDLSLQINDVLNGYVYGRYNVVDRMPLLEPVEGMTMQDDFKVAAGTASEPRHVKLKDLSETDYADYVVIDTTQMVLENNRAYAVDGDRKVRVFNTFGLRGLKSPSVYEGKYFNLTGIFGTHWVDDELIDELYLMASPKEVAAPTAIQGLKSEGMRAVLGGDRLLLTGLQGYARVSIYAVDGHCVACAEADANGVLSLSTARWAAGVYVVKANGRAEKLLKR